MSAHKFASCQPFDHALRIAVMTWEFEKSGVESSATIFITALSMLGADLMPFTKACCPKIWAAATLAIWFDFIG